MENIDIGKTYADIESAISAEDHEQVLILADKILKNDPKEKEALQCKIVSLINLSKNEEVISIVENKSLQTEFSLEYAYALHENKRYIDSIQALKKQSGGNEINELLAQNYYKLGNFKESYGIYKNIIEHKLKNSDEIEEEKDLISNFLAVYSLSNADDENVLRSLMKFLNTWESFFNYCVICLKQGKLNESIETLLRMRRDYPQQGEEFNELNNLNLNLNIIQTAMEGFDLTKHSTLVSDYEKTILSQNKTQGNLSPYFYNNFLQIKKDRESLSEVLKKLDGYLKTDSLFPNEKNILLMNKIILLLRVNRMNEALELFKNLPSNYDDVNYVVLYCYIVIKQEKHEKFEDLLNNDHNLKNKPEAHLILIQMMLSTLTSKNIEQFHLKVLNFIKQFFNFTLNFNFLNFFLGFYESRHLKEYLREFIKNYKDPAIVYQMNKLQHKQCLSLLAKSFYTVGMYEESVNFWKFILENIDRSDKNVKLELIYALSHINTVKSEELRRQIDETTLDLSNEHISVLLSEVFFKNKKNQGEKKKTKNKKKKRFPKNFDPKKPGPLPDPERWMPRLQRKKFRNVNKNKLAYQGATADHSTTSNQFKK